MPDLVAAAKARWRTGAGPRNLKEELGLDHFEDHSWVSWCYHIALFTTALAFLRRE